MKVICISGPYRSKDGPNGIYQNIQRAREAALKYWQAGFAVICPHLNTAFMDGACDDSVWLAGDLEIVKRCDYIYMLTGWEQSEGSLKEHDIAIDYGLTVIYQDEEETE